MSHDLDYRDLPFGMKKHVTDEGRVIMVTRMRRRRRCTEHTSNVFDFGILEDFVTEEHRKRCVLSFAMTIVHFTLEALHTHALLVLSFFLLRLMRVCVFFFVSLSIITYLTHSGIPLAS